VRILLSGAASPLGILLQLRLARPGVSLSCVDQVPGLAGTALRVWEPGSDPIPVAPGGLSGLLRDVDVVVETGVAGTVEEYGGGPGGGGPGVRGSGGRSVGAAELGRAVLVLATLPEQPPARYVLASTGSVYGASPRNPALFAEDHTGFRVSATVADRYSDRYSESGVRGLAELPAAAAGVADLGAHRLGSRGSSESAVTLERYARGTARRCPGTAVHLVRLAELLGPHVSGGLAAFLRSPVVPMVAGFDPRLSLLHEADAADALDRIAGGASPAPAPGRVDVLNVAGRGVVTVSALAHGLGRVRVFVPGPVLRSLSPGLRALLTYGRCLDVTRLAEILDWTPTRTGLQVLGATAADRGPGLTELLRGAAADLVGGLAPAVLGSLGGLLGRGPDSR
jgi:hypothetical protein